MTAFVINRSAILDNPRVSLLTNLLPIEETLDNIEKFINICFVDQGDKVVQSGRVIAVRSTDKNRLASAFKAAIYLGKFHDMANVNRFLKNMLAAGHSYEPIRGEHIMFLYIGVGKPVYDHLVTYSVGRYGRIAAGQRANLPWGYEVPVEARNPEYYVQKALPEIAATIEIVKGLGEMDKEQMQAARSLLPVGYIMPPFVYEFSEEALINIFRQRIWEPGAQGATKEIVFDMLGCCQQLDPEKWEWIEDYHGPHIMQWLKVMRTLRDKPVSLADILTKLEETGVIPVTDEHNLHEIDAYKALMTLFGSMPKSMWEK